MPEPLKTFRIVKKGFWNPRHVVSDDEGEIGVLTVERKRGRIYQAIFRPKKGEVLFFRRDPGVLRGQFSLWTDGREWLGSSLRWSLFRREFQLETGTRPYRVVPLPSFTRGWRLCGPKTGEMARFDAGLFGRTTRIEVYRRVDFELWVFAYFVGSQVYLESLWPGPVLEGENESVPSPSKA